MSRMEDLRSIENNRPIGEIKVEISGRGWGKVARATEELAEAFKRLERVPGIAPMIEFAYGDPMPPLALKKTSGRIKPRRRARARRRSKDGYAWSRSRWAHRQSHNARAWG